MNRYNPKLLVVNDNDVHCKTPDDLGPMTLDNLNFLPKDVEKFDLIVYQGKRGTKILKSEFFRTGIIKN
jgi:hypothetical protein